MSTAFRVERQEPYFTYSIIMNKSMNFSHTNTHMAKGLDKCQ